MLAATQFSLFEGWRLEGAIQYSTEWSKISKTSAGIRYNPRDFSTVALYYRYNYNPNDKREDFYNTNIKQVDFSFQWPIMKDLYGLGRYNYSFRDKKWLTPLWASNIVRGVGFFAAPYSVTSEVKEGRRRTSS